MRVKKSLAMFDVLTVTILQIEVFLECDVMGQVGVYIAEGHSAFIFRILQSKPDPEDGGTIVL